MNPQEYQTPPRWWPSRLSPFVIRHFTRRRNRALRRQGIRRIHVHGTEIVSDAIREGAGVLVVSNHSYHYDSFVLMEAGLRGNWHPQIMTAWQVFMMYRWFGRWSLQRHGCFSVNREGLDTKAFKQAMEILTHGRHPLTIYPEGDIYHSNDKVMPFREGAAAIALMAARQNVRPIVMIPCAMKCFYCADPTQELHDMMGKLEAEFLWRPRADLPLIDRIYRFGEGLLSLKEIEYLGHPRQGELRDRIQFLASAVLNQVRVRRGLPIAGHDLGEQIRHLRSQIVKQINQLQEQTLGPRRIRGRKSRQNRRVNLAKSARNGTLLKSDRLHFNAELQARQVDLRDLFFVTQLSSYHGDYALQKPSLERMAETIDKYEEDIFSLAEPTPRGQREAYVRFGPAQVVSPHGPGAVELTERWEHDVQRQLDEINRHHAGVGESDPEAVTAAVFAQP